MTRSRESAVSPGHGSTVSAADMAYLADLVRREAGIMLAPDHGVFVESRLAPLVWRDRLPSLAALVAELRAAAPGPRHREVVAALAIPETNFFRDGLPFELLRRVVLPWLMEQRANERRLSFWCAAAATGQEAYSLAMLCREQKGVPSPWVWEILGTDLSEDNVRRAAAGIYSESEVRRGLDPPHLSTYFEKQGKEWRVKEDLRVLVHFRPFNLVAPWPSLSSMDLILLRNVTMYFDTATRRTVFSKAHEALRPDGFLLLGAGETAQEAGDLFDLYQWNGVALYRPRGAPSGPRELAAESVNRSGAL
ncbi:MAG: protein-glutamate O-methyltransferase CheR [Elusimicrobia bacterium]|nr:protein-glutamate O-methyltransferase CheR [Elusimicrobiota bacterium]